MSTVFQLYSGLDVISLTTAKTRDQVHYSIHKVPKVERLPEPACRPRYISRDQAERLMAELPEHLAAMERVSLATGPRQRNVVELEWSQVDMDRRCAWIFADQAKGARGIALALNSEPMAVLRQQPRIHKRVFLYKGRPVSPVNNHAWRKALRRAGIENFRLHDLRSTWATWHRQAGIALIGCKSSELGAQVR